MTRSEENVESMEGGCIIVEWLEFSSYHSCGSPIDEMKQH
mgnify:CR=1 FL=1